MRNSFATLLLFLLAFSVFSQRIGYEIYGTLTNPYAEPYSLLTLDTLKGARTLSDINTRYRPDWVASYIRVEVASTCGEESKKAISTNDILTTAQMNILKTTDIGCNIDVEVDYIPENTLKDNPPRKMAFSLRMVPIYEAKYPGGQQALKMYLKENVIDEILRGRDRQLELAKIKFTINEEGHVSDVNIFKTSEDDEMDQIMLKAICNMPNWSPAKNREGEKIIQEFELSMGTTLLRCDYKY